MCPTDDVAGPHESALVVVVAAIDVLRGVARLRDIYPDLPELPLDYGNVLDEVAFALSVGSAIDPWFAAARRGNAEVDAMLRFAGR